MEKAKSRAPVPSESPPLCPTCSKTSHVKQLKIFHSQIWKESFYGAFSGCLPSVSVVIVTRQKLHTGEIRTSTRQSGLFLNSCETNIEDDCFSRIR